MFAHIRQRKQGGNMSSYQKVQAAITATATAAVALQEFDERRAAGEYADAPLAANKEHATLVAAVQAADRAAIAEYRKHESERVADASTKRAKAEASRDPALRMADELEAARLTASPVSADVLARRAADMLAAGQPERAAFLLGVAQAKGFREIDDRVAIAVSDALDVTDDDRKAARAIEDGLTRERADFTASRYRILAQSVGVDASDQAGTGGGRASANAAAKIADYVAKTSRGEQYHADPADLVLDKQA